MIQINPLKSYIDGGVRAALTTPPSASLVFDLPGKAIWVKGVKLKGTDHTYTFSHDNYITLTNTPDSNESEDIKIGVNTSALKSAIDTTYGVVSTTANGLAPKFISGNKLAATAATTYYFLGWTGSTLKWYQAPFRNIRINSETTDCLGVNNTDPLIISSGNGISVTWDSTNKKIIITNTKPDVNHNTDTKVALSATTLNKNYAVILKGNDSDEGSITTVNFSTYLKFNPNTKLLTINGNKVITTIDTFIGATTSADGSVGLVTKPLIANRLLFLRGDGTWATPSNTWRPVKVEGTEKLGSNALDLSAGNGISIIYNNDTKKIIITNTKPDVNHNTDRTGIKLVTVSGTKKTDSTLILANSTTGLSIQGGTNKFLIGNGTNYIEVPVVPSVSNKDATIGTTLTTLATIAGVDIKAKIASYSLSSHTHSVKINGSTKTITSSGTVNLGDYLPSLRMRNPSNGTSEQGGIPFPISLKSAGYPVYTDPEFASGYNNITVYNNSSNGAVTISRIEDNQGSSNSSGYILQISTTTNTASPGRGGFILTIYSRKNAVFAQIFRAKIPIGFNVVNAENHMGKGYSTYWLTDTAGTGKWEWYIRITICGTDGSFSNGGHVYLSGSGAVTWYLSYCNLIDLTKGNYDGLRTRYSDYATSANNADTATNVDWGGIKNKPNYAAGDAIGGSANYLRWEKASSSSYARKIPISWYDNKETTTTRFRAVYSDSLTYRTDTNTISSNISGNAATATNADKLDGYHATCGTNKPWGTIPVITTGGYMDVGRHFEFHYDNTTGSDYSTLLGCTGNYSNIVYLPSASGTLALTSQIPNVTNYYWANIKISSASSTSTNPTFATATTITSITTPLVTNSNVLTLNGTSGVYIKYNNNDLAAIILSNTYFKPFDVANNKLSLGTNSARWSNVCSVLGDFTGLISTNTLKITNTSATAHITFSRNNYNYIVAPAGGSIGFCVNGSTMGSANCEIVILDGTIFPGTTNVTSLGSASYYWTSVYSQGFYKNGSNNDYALMGGGGHKNISNVLNTAFYKRVATVNGSGWDMAGTNSHAAFTIYAPTTAGTNNQILKSTGGIPTWINQSDLSVGNADTVDLYHATSAGSLFYKYEVTATIPASSITGDFWYATITFSRSYVYKLTKSLIDAGYSNIQGLVYLNTYEYGGAWYAFTTNYNGCNIKGIALKTQNNPIYYVKLAKPVLYLNIIPNGKITVYSPYNCTITVSSTAPSGVTFTNITIPGFTNLKANSASMADLATTATYASNVGTAGTAGTNYVTASKVIATCNWYDTMISTDSDNIINRWSEIVAFVANFKETPDLATYLNNNYLAKSGGTMIGPLKWANSTALPELTSPKYFVCIDAFTDGGITKWTSKTNTLKALTGLTSAAIGDSNEPVYWNGTTFVKANAYPTKASWNYDDVYSKKYYYSLPPKKCVKISYSEKSPVIISACRNNGGGLFLLVGLGYGADGWVHNLFRCLIPSQFFTWKLSADSCTVELYHNTTSSNNAEIKVITTGNIVFTETDALSGSADTKRFACFDELTWANIENKPSSFTPSSHTHNYLPLSGGSLTGTLRINCPTSLNNNYNEGIRCNLGGKNSWASVVLGGANGSTSGSGNGVYSLLVNASLFRIRQNSTDVILINTSNNVGIGTTSPSYKLHVVGDIFTTTGFKKNGSSNSYVLLGGGGHKLISDFATTAQGIGTVISINKSLTPTTSWIDTGIKTDSATFPEGNGSYIVQISIPSSSGTDGWGDLYTGYFSLFTGTDSSTEDEILLHGASHSLVKRIYLKTKATAKTDGTMHFYIASEKAFSAARTINFKFRKLI